MWAPCGKNIRRAHYGERSLGSEETAENNLCRTASQVSTPHGAYAWREGVPMDALTEQEMEAIVQRLETLVTALEHDANAPTFYAFVLLAQEFAGTKHVGFTLAHLRRCLAL